MTVPYTFGTATTSIPLSNLDANFNTPITLGNTAIYLGNTTTTIGNLTLTNVTISSGTANITSNITYATANAVVFTNASSIGTTNSSLSFNGTNLGVGNANPQALLHVGSVVEAPGFGTTSQMTYINGTSQPEVLVRQTANDVVVSMFADSTSGSIRTATNHPLVFSTNNNERMRINAGAPILCLSGGSTTATGTGIAFPSTQSASSDANTLDDYEEGTWTPIDSSGNGLTFTGVSAYYTKIGDMVFATFALVYPVTASSFNNRIGGLPFTTAAGTEMNAFNVAYTTYTPGLMSPLDGSATTFTLYDTTTVAAINNTALISKLVRGTCIYKVA